MSRRKPRGLSAEDRALWDGVRKSLTPLKASTAPAPKPPTPPKVEIPAEAAAPKPARTLRPSAKQTGPKVRLDLAPDPMEGLKTAAPRMDAKTHTKLKRGKLAPEARIDLHGMTADRAHRALISFLTRAQANGVRTVLVITGKGREAQADDIAPRRGVLRSALPHWLSQHPLSEMVLQVVPAHARHGGGGAYYVYLRRPR